MRQGAMLNFYPDSLGRNLSEAVDFLSMPEMKDVFQSIYLLPSVFNSDIDRGYSIISYDLAETVATEADFARLREMGMDMLFDFILNHLSVLSAEFRDILKNGDASPYRDFFIDWNKFWEGCGEKDENGVIVPDPEKYGDSNRRKTGLPILMVRFPDGREVPYWNTFFQKVSYPTIDEIDLIDFVDSRYDLACQLSERINRGLKSGLTPKTLDWTGYEFCKDAVIDYLESRRRYLGQMDVNLKNPMVWEWFERVMAKLASLGASMIRLDALFCLLKEPGKVFSTTSPEALHLLDQLGKMAAVHGMGVLPENHVAYKTGFHIKQWEMGIPCYDYFLPALLIDAMDLGESRWVYKWASEQAEAGIRTINMLGCHDGIPLRDPRGALPDEQVDVLEERLVERGGRRKYVHGDETAEVYQMDIAYYSAIGCDDRKMTLARAVQIFMPGKPQIWYQDLLAGANDLEVFERIPDADNREINRHNYSLEEIRENLQRPVVQEQLRLLRFRNTHPVFTEEAIITTSQPDEHTVTITWKNGEHFSTLEANFRTLEYKITASEC